MNTTTINLKIDTTLKDQAAQVADDLGMSLGTLIKVLLKQTVRKKGIQLDLREEHYPAEQMTPEMEQLIGEIEAEMHAGTLQTMSHDDFIVSLEEDGESTMRNTSR